MREFIYSIPTEDRLAFEKRFQQDFSALWAPGHLYAGLRAILAIAFGALIFGAIPQIERALAVFAISLFLFWGFQSALEKITSRYYLKFLRSLPDVETYRTQLDEEYLTTENRRYRSGFSLSEATGTFVDSGFVYVDFSKLGRVRVPFSAFLDESERQEFQRIIQEKIRNNKAASEYRA